MKIVWLRWSRVGCFVGLLAVSAQAQPVFSLRVVQILDADFVEKPCPSCGDAGASEIQLGEAVPGDSFVIEAFASRWDVFPDRGLCQGGQTCRISNPQCPDTHCADTNNGCNTAGDHVDCNFGALCVPDTCTPDPLVGAFQFTMNAETFTNGLPSGFDVPQIPCDAVACDDDPFFEGCSCLHGLPPFPGFEFSFCHRRNDFGLDTGCIPGVCSGGPNEGRECASASDCLVCVGGGNDGSACDRDNDCFGGGLCQASGGTCEDFFRCCLGASAYIDLSRHDYLLGAFASIDAVDISSEDFTWIGALQQAGIVAEKLGCGGDVGMPCTFNKHCRFCVGGLIAGTVCSLDADCAACVGGENAGLSCATSLGCPGSICDDTGTCPFTDVTCNRIPSYLGTLFLQSATCSVGSYTINFVDNDELTFMNDNGSLRMPAPILDPVTIHFPAVVDPCDTFPCDNSDLCNPQACVNASAGGDLCGGPTCEVRPVNCPPREFCNPVTGLCGPAVQECALIHSSFACGDTLPRLRNNLLRFTFDCGTATLPAPGPGDVLIRRLLDAGGFGTTDLSGSFTITTNGNELVVEEIGGVLTDTIWYGITGQWGIVKAFEMGYAVVHCDVTNDGFTDVVDTARVLANRADPAPPDSRFDVNGSGGIDVTDVANTLAHRGSFAFQKPTGHACTLP